MFFISALLSCVAGPLWSFSPRALYLASEPFSLLALLLQDSLVITMFICVLVCANVILLQVPTWPSGRIRPYGLSYAHFPERGFT